MWRKGLTFCAMLLSNQLLVAQQHYISPKKIVMGYYPSLADYTQNPVLYQDLYYVDDSLYYPAGVQTEAFDSAGNLLFWSNGFTVSALHYPTIKGGDTLSNSSIHNLRRWSGIPVCQTSLAIPVPNNANLYYLFYSDLTQDSFCLNNDVICLLYYAVIDMQADSGRGEVVSKQNLISDTLATFAGINATRHANGRDWWIIRPDWGGDYPTGGYYVALIDTEGIHPFAHQIAVGAPEGNANHNRGFTAFSPDGEWLACGGITKAGYSLDANQYAGFELLRFDRCTGKFNDCHAIIPPWQNPRFWNIQPVFSPSGRFLYVNNGADLFQYDMWVDDIEASVYPVFIAPASFGGSGYWGNFGATVMPDSSISLCTNGHFFTLIKQPDKKGADCEFALDTPQNYNYDYIPALTSFFPYYPNYNLEVKECSSDITQLSKSIVWAYPNPASLQLWVDYESIQWQIAHNVTLAIHDALGREVYTQKLPIGSTKQIIDIHTWSAGVYIYSLLFNGERIGAGKFVKE